MHAKHLLMGLVAALAAATAGHAASDEPTQKPFVVHEWGTFLAVQGSDGVTLGGMVDSDEVLPAFVEARGPASFARMNMFSKMETPVTYFYTDRPRTVHVRIDMPKGLLTHWFPLVAAYGPIPGNGPAKPEKSFLQWSNVQVLPVTGYEKVLSPVADNQNWRFARETDAALLKVVTHRLDEKSRALETKDQYEGFLFYRGLGTFTLPLSVQSIQASNGNISLKLTNESAQPLNGLFAIQVENQTIRFGSARNLESHSSHDQSLSTLLGKSLPLEEGVPLVKQAVARALIEAGLYEKEAQAMVNTWERSYFRTEGLRMLYLLPRPAVDAAIPIQIQPAPDQLVRVMVGRVEILTPERERQIEKYISQLGSVDFRSRQGASDGLAHLGRIGEPALRRVSKTTHDPEVRARAAQLIQQFESR
jgi:hypothetical protein